MLNVETQTIGNRYHLIDKLGEGGMGAVYCAEDRLSGQNVALKRVSLSHIQSDEQISDLRYALAQEFKVLASLRHPHVISVLDYGFADNREPYFTLELLENSQSLVEYAQSKSLAKQVELLIQMLQALAYLHQRGIIHRDLKPGNVMIVNHQLKVLDFGLAVARERLSPESELVGTLFYMAPEIFSGASASIATDLDDWLQQVGTVIEARGSHYWFAHDKLREDILISLPTDERRGIHHEIAQAIESAYSASPEQYAARDYRMPYYEALAHYHLGRFMPQSDPDRARHLETALTLLDQIGAAYDAECVRQVLR